jgi:hypothetical protein
MKLLIFRENSMWRGTGCIGSILVSNWSLEVMSPWSNQVDEGTVWFSGLRQTMWIHQLTSIMIASKGQCQTFVFLENWSQLERSKLKESNLANGQFSRLRMKQFQFCCVQCIQRLNTLHVSARLWCQNPLSLLAAGLSVLPGSDKCVGQVELYV